MKDQSHKDEMSAAIRGDFQRLRERGVAATLAPQLTTDNACVESPQALEPEAARRVETESRVEAAREPDPEPDTDVPAEGSMHEHADSAEDAESGEAYRPGFLTRLFGR